MRDSANREPIRGFVSTDHASEVTQQLMREGYNQKAMSWQDAEVCINTEHQLHLIKPGTFRVFTAWNGRRI